MSGAALGDGIALNAPFIPRGPLHSGACEYAVHPGLPVTTDDLDAGIARARQQGRARRALVAVQLAGQHGAQHDDVVLEVGMPQIEAELLRKGAAHRHDLEAGVALGFADAVAPTPV